MPKPSTPYECPKCHHSCSENCCDLDIDKHWPDSLVICDCGYERILKELKEKH